MSLIEVKATPSQPIIELLKANAEFQALAVPIDHGRFPIIHDAEFYVHRNGFIVNAEGWCHPDGKLIGEVLYAPDDKGERIIFGQKYRKITLFPGTLTPIPYNQRVRNPQQYGCMDDQADAIPFFALYKQIFRHNAFEAFLPNVSVLQKIAESFPEAHDKMLGDIENAEMLLGKSFDRSSLGVTGAFLLGNFTTYHDFDLVITSSPEQNLRIAKAMRDLVVAEPHRRVTEGGKGWNIRFYNDNGTLMCNFFGYRRPEEAPLRRFEMEVISPDVTIEGCISDDMHSIYTPTILGIEKAKVVDSRSSLNASLGVTESLQLVVYHTATRGECFSGDFVRARGAYVHIDSDKGSYKALCVIEREGVRNLTPSWEDFYHNPSAMI